MAVGRCAIDPDHMMHFVGDDTRWLTDNDHRECLWCRKHSQKLRHWVESVEHSAWEPVMANASQLATGATMNSEKMEGRDAVADQIERPDKPLVGDSNFEAWFEKFLHSGKDTKQAMREAYDAGLQEATRGYNSQLVAAALEVVHHMDGRTPVRGWLRDNDDSRKALDRLAKVLEQHAT